MDSKIKKKAQVRVKKGEQEFEWSASDWAGSIILAVAVIVAILLIMGRTYEAMIATFFGGGFGLSEVLKHFQKSSGVRKK
jgi:hypothetical protein